jgi:hypothetical protein
MKNLLPYLFPKIARLPAARNIITRVLCDTGERAWLDNRLPALRRWIASAHFGVNALTLHHPPIFLSE